MIISHIKEHKGKWIFQSNEEHQHGVAALASKFAESFGMAEWGRVLGLLHDVGKEKKAFQQHIMKESGYSPEIKVDGDSSHAYVGGLVAKQILPQESVILSNIIMGHHRGLYNDGDWEFFLNERIPLEVTIPQINAQLAIPRMKFAKEDFHHLVRMLFSCLVDADYLDTEAFMSPEQARLRGSKTTMMELSSKLEAFIDRLSSNALDNEVN